MTGDILVTDTLFVGPGHEKLLRSRGYTVSRLDKPKATEDELCTAIRGKIGYILGGIESVTEKVISAADKLKAIAFTGSGYSEFIPSHELATKRGIAITAATGGNADAVAEYTLALILMMARSVPLLTTSGGTSFWIGEAFQDLTVGVIGYGHVGREVAALCSKLGFSVVATSRTRTSGTDGKISFLNMDALISRADIVTVHVDKVHGTNVLDQNRVRQLKKGSRLINAAFPHAIDSNVLLSRIADKEIFAAFDAPIDNAPTNLPAGYFIQSNGQTAFNTHRTNNQISDMVVSSLLSVLSTGDDKYLVNPGYRKYVKP